MTTPFSTFRFALLAAALAFSPLSASLHAQSAPAVRVNVPFAFQNGSHVLPAGVYRITQGNSGVLLILGSKDSAMTMSRIEDSNGNVDAPAKVVFERYGDKYFLREVWRSGTRSHAVCPKTSAEIKAQKAILSMVTTATSPIPTGEISLASATR